MEKLKHIIASVLLVALSASFFPLESFHHHDEDKIICNKTNTHFDEHAVACDLCDFVLQEFTVQESTVSLIRQIKYSNFQEAYAVKRISEQYQIPLQRGPPSVL